MAPGASLAEESELSRLVGREWLELTGIADGFEERIHEADEMFLTARRAEQANVGRSRLQYYRDGHEVVASLNNLLDATGRSFRSCGRILEMACGFGRVTRHLVREIPPECITAVEIIEPAVDFVADTFGVDARRSCTDPVDFDLGEEFDLIVVSSLFSHLPRARFGEWLEALYAALTPRGMLVFSTHGAGVLPEVPKDPSGFTFIPQSESLGLDGEEYGSTFVDQGVVDVIAREHGVAHLVSLERELWMLQDVHVASKQPVRGIERWRHVSFVQGVVDRMIVRDGAFHVDGWAADTRPEVPMSGVKLLLDGREVALIPVGNPRIDVARVKGRPDWLQSGWALEGRVPEVEPGRHLLAAQGISATGASGVLDIVAVDL